MYLIIPLSIFIVSVIGITVIVWRKIPYLRKLTTEVGPGANFWSDFAPELVSFYNRLNIGSYRNKLLLEMEKFLRRFRLVFLKIDSLSDTLIKKLRRGHAAQETIQSPAEKVVETPIVTGVRAKKSKA